jgi:crotonobetainyl-CoA:carnitine CoA-transferase CaiB-like acyl-CoA transferase
MAATEAVVTEWTTSLGKWEVAAAARRYKVPCAPVRNAVDVMNDPHMHERGMLQRIQHPSLGEIVVPNSPLRLHGADRVSPVPSPKLGEHNVDVYCGWLGIPEADMTALIADGVI